MLKVQPPETYLGDGLYASYDGYHFILRTPRGHRDHWVYLDPQVLEAFLIYIGKVTNSDIAFLSRVKPIEGASSGNQS